jgi:large subunit ribosomal protein L6
MTQKKKEPGQKKHEGELELKVTEGVKIDAKGRTITVSGSRGSITRKFMEDFINIVSDGEKVKISAKTKRFPLRKQMAIMGSIAGHIKNMMKGVTEGYTYRLRIVYSHFPMKVSVKGLEFTVDNFLGEKYPRKTKVLEGVKVEIKGNEVTVTGIDKEKVGQTAANIEQVTKIKKLDPRVFQDGVYIIEKDGKPIV